MSEIISVIGAGNGGTAIAAHMASLGAKVNLCDLYPQYLDGMLKSGGVHLTVGGETSFQTFQQITTDLETALPDSKLIMVVTPSFTHKMIARACAPILRDGQMIVLNPGRTGGALEFINTLRNCGCEAQISVSEAQTLIYSCRKTSEQAVEVYGVKKNVALGTLPACRAQDVLRALHPYYPQFTPAKNCLQTSLANIGALFHPAPLLLNAGRVETPGEHFKYYWDGISPSVAAMIECLDAERMAVANAYDTPILSAKEWLLHSYDTKGNTLYELIQNNRAYGDIYAPDTLQARYITEDVPMSLVPIAALGHLAGVATPHMDAVIRLASSICGTDFEVCGRSLHNLGLENMTKEQVIEYFETGCQKGIYHE